MRLQRELGNLLTEKQMGTSVSPSWKLNVGHIPTFISWPPSLQTINSVGQATELMKFT